MGVQGMDLADCLGRNGRTIVWDQRRDPLVLIIYQALYVMRTGTNCSDKVGPRTIRPTTPPQTALLGRSQLPRQFGYSSWSFGHGENAIKWRPGHNCLTDGRSLDYALYLTAPPYLSWSIWISWWRSCSAGGCWSEWRRSYISCRYTKASYGEKEGGRESHTQTHNSHPNQKLPQPTFSNRSITGAGGPTVRYSGRGI